MTLEAGRLFGEVAVLGLGRSGLAAARLLHARGQRVYASDASSADAAQQAAQALRAEGIDAEAGRHDLARLMRAARVIASPGIPPTAPPIEAALAAGVPLVSEVELGLGALDPRRTRVIAVTGTNGKTTVTALIGHLLRALGHDAVEAGNIGTPLAEVARRDPAPSWVALEISSFQLHDTPGIAPAVGVLTTLSPDHLDRYPTLDAYYADKALMVRNATPASRWVWNADQPAVQALWRGAAGTHHRFGVTDASGDAWLDRSADMLWVLGAPLLARAELPLLGDHNVANALSGALAVMVADPAHRTADARAAIAQGLRTFGGMPHRLEVVGEFGGVLWINDSKATNVDSARVAIDGMTRPTVVLLGGRHKGEPYTGLRDALRAHAKLVLAYGEAAPLVEADLAGHVPLERLGSSFEQVMARARATAAPGDAVLLAPACSSFDMFANYDERGRAFRRLAAAG